MAKVGRSSAACLGHGEASREPSWAETTAGSKGGPLPFEFILFESLWTARAATCPRLWLEGAQMSPSNKVWNVDMAVLWGIGGLGISAVTKVEGSLIAMASQEICLLFHGSQIMLVDSADSTGVRKGSKRLIGRMDRDRSAAWPASG